MNIVQNTIDLNNKKIINFTKDINNDNLTDDLIKKMIEHKTVQIESHKEGSEKLMESNYAFTTKSKNYEFKTIDNEIIHVANEKINGSVGKQYLNMNGYHFPKDNDLITTEILNKEKYLQDHIKNNKELVNKLYENIANYHKCLEKLSNNTKTVIENTDENCIEVMKGAMQICKITIDLKYGTNISDL